MKNSPNLNRSYLAMALFYGSILKLVSLNATEVLTQHGDTALKHSLFC